MTNGLNDYGVKRTTGKRQENLRSTVRQTFCRQGTDFFFVERSKGYGRFKRD